MQRNHWNLFGLKCQRKGQGKEKEKERKQGRKREKGKGNEGKEKEESLTKYFVFSPQPKLSFLWIEYEIIQKFRNLQVSLESRLIPSRIFI